MNVDAVWDVLVAECGAPDTPEDRAAFRLHWPECTEYRFVGKLGFGGKVWSGHGRVYVSCYTEDETPDRRSMIAKANQRLAEELADPSVS